jgi:hypothetical protein
MTKNGREKTCSLDLVRELRFPQFDFSEFIWSEINVKCHPNSPFPSTKHCAIGDNDDRSATERSQLPFPWSLRITVVWH